MFTHSFAPWRAESFGNTATAKQEDLSYCHCGTNLKPQLMANNAFASDQSFICMHCFESVEDVQYWCYNMMYCEFYKVNGFLFNTCSKCFGSLKGFVPNNKYKMEILSLSLQTTKKKIEKKQPFELRHYLPVFHNYFSSITRNYCTYSVYLEQKQYDKLTTMFEALYNHNLPLIVTAIDEYHLGQEQELNDIEEKEQVQNEEKSKHVECECSSISKCQSIQRMNEMLTVYIKYVGEEPLKTTFLNLFHSQSYSIHKLLNHYIHILQHHQNENADYEQVFAKCCEKRCNAQKKLFSPQKLYKEKNKEWLRKVENSNLSQSEIVIIEYLNLFHTLFQHQSVNQLQSAQLQSDHNLFNKFGTVIDLKDNNDCKQQLDETRAVGSYSFGINFVYWKGCEHRQNFVSAKYQSLKEEMMSNKYCCLKLQQFHLTHKKAVMLRQSNNGKSMNCRVRFAEIGMPLNLCITISHLMTLLFYCNYYAVQGKFKKFGTRKLTEKEDWLKDVMPRHAEMANYFKLLTETVLCFGEEVCENAILYHGISVPLLFDEYTPSFKAPFSTTSSLKIAQEFATRNGIILGLIPLLMAGDRMYNVEWLSAYPEQKERLFSKADALNIADIRVAPNIVTMNNALDMKALSLFDNMLNLGFYFIINVRKQRKKTQNRLIQFLDQYEKLKKSTIAIPKYMFDLFCALIEKKKRIKFDTLYLVQSDFECLQKQFQSRMNGFVLRIFEENHKMSREFMQEYIWQIEGGTMILFKASPINFEFAGAMQHYFGKSGGVIPFAPVMKRCCLGHLKTTFFGIQVMRLPPVLQQKGINIFCSFVVDDRKLLKYCMNGAYQTNVPIGGYLWSRSFSNELLNDNMLHFTIRYVIRFEVPK